MQAFYVNNIAGIWSVDSINRNGIHMIPKWKPYPPEAEVEYLRLHALAESSDA
jgi:hypothetical protein